MLIFPADNAGQLFLSREKLRKRDEERGRKEKKEKEEEEEEEGGEKEEEEEQKEESGEEDVECEDMDEVANGMECGQNSPVVIDSRPDNNGILLHPGHTLKGKCHGGGTHTHTHARTHTPWPSFLLPSPFPTRQL